MIEKSTKGLQILEDTEFKKIATFIVIGVLLFSMIFSCFSYLIYALQSV